MAIAEAKSGRADGASSTTLGRIGRASGAAASRRIMTSLLDAASFKSGSSLVRDTPDSCAFDRSPAFATCERRRVDSTCERSSFTATLFPTLSTSGDANAFSDK